MEWPVSCYLTIMDCNEKGIVIHQDNKIKCKIGYTSGYPKRRSNSGDQSRNSQLIDSTMINEEGAVMGKSNKIKVESELYVSLNPIVEWYKNSKEIFFIKKNNFHKMKKIFRDITEKYIKKM